MNAAANLGVILVCNELCCGVICTQGSLSLMLLYAWIFSKWAFVQHGDILSRF